MPIDRNLLTKAAKVYEAAEAVEGMKPKEVYESHKKCTPGEFGMHKEGGNKKADLYGAYMGGTNGATLGGLLGGGLGGVGGLAAGALSSRKGRRVGDTLRGGLKGLVGGGLLGAGAGAGLGASAAGQLPVRAIIDAAKRGNPLSADELRLRMSDGLNPATFAGLTTLGTLGGAAAGGALGGAANHALFDNKKEDNDTDKKKTEKKSADPRMPMPVDGPNHEYLRKSLGRDYYENRYAPSHSGQLQAAATADAIMNTAVIPAALRGLGRTIFGPGMGDAAGNLYHVGSHLAAKPLGGMKKKGEFDDLASQKSAFDFGMRVKQSLEMPTLSSLGNVGVGGLAGAGLGGLYGLMNPGEEEDEHGRMRRRSRFGAALRGALGGGVLGAGGGALASYLAGRFGQSQPPMPANMTPMPGGKLRYAPPVKSLDQIATERARHMNMKSQIPADGPELVFPGTPEAGAMEQ